MGCVGANFENGEAKKEVYTCCNYVRREIVGTRSNTPVSEWNEEKGAVCECYNRETSYFCNHTIFTPVFPRLIPNAQHDHTYV